MLPRYHSHFLALTPDQLASAWGAVHRRYPDRIPACPADATPDEFLLRIEDSQLDHAQVVLCMAPATTLPAIEAVETLVGKPIIRGRAQLTPSHSRASGYLLQQQLAGGTNRQPRPSTTPRQPAPSVDASMVVLSVVPNPKKQGTASYDRFAKYRVGMTLGECYAAGISKGDIKWDTERSFVVFGPATEEK